MVPRRTSVDLAEPPEDLGALADFPRQELDTEAPLWRAVRAGYGPWWFDSTPHGRFNLPEPEGTCYLARDEIAAVLEVVGPDRTGGVISREFFAERRLRRLSVPRPVSLADLTSRRAARYGVTLEVHAVVPYELPRAWALRLRRSGAGGLRYFVRHDPSGREGVALFGRAGERSSWRRGREVEISDEVLEKLAEETGIAIAPIPDASQLSLIS